MNDSPITIAKMKRQHLSVYFAIKLYLLTVQASLREPDWDKGAVSYLPSLELYA